MSAYFIVFVYNACLFCIDLSIIIIPTMLLASMLLLLVIVTWLVYLNYCVASGEIAHEGNHTDYYYPNVIMVSRARAPTVDSQA